jgi:hypothetical protein
MATTIVLDYTEGDTERDLTVVATEEDDPSTPVDITGYTITLHMARPNGSLLSKPAVITNPTAGEFRFEWVTTDLLAGCQNVEIQLISPSNEIETFPKGDDIIALNVRKEIL